VTELPAGHVAPRTERLCCEHVAGRRVHRGGAGARGRGAAGELVHVLIDGLTEAARRSAAPATAARSTGRDVLARARAWIQRLRLSA
jgi:hypothetical protein